MLDPQIRQPWFGPRVTLALGSLALASVVLSVSGCGESGPGAQPDAPTDVSTSDAGAREDMAAEHSGLCLNDLDGAVFDGLATTERSGPDLVSEIAADCPARSCGAILAEILFDNTEDIRGRMGACIAECLVEQTGLSEGCAGCYGFIGACAAGYCIGVCATDSASEACRACVDDNCTDTFVTCTGSP